MAKRIEIDLKKAEQLYKELNNLSKVGKVLGCSGETITRRFRESGIPINDRSINHSDPNLNNMINDYESGSSLKQCGLKYGMSHVAARKILRSRGVDMRPAGGRNY